MTTNHPAPAETVALFEPTRAPTSDEEERLLVTVRAAQVAGTFPSDSAIRLLTDGYGAGESERRHCMAAARLALAYWGHAWGYLATNQPAPAAAADQILAALRELTNAVVDEFFGNDTNLSKRLIKATNEAQLLLIVQPPDDDRVNRPAPAEPATSNDIPPGLFSEQDLREAWNGQADQFNQWDSLDSWEQLAWAQTRAIAADRARQLTPPADRAGRTAPARLRHCPIHGQQPPEAWGCPECLRELREELAMLRRQAAPVPVSERPWTNEAGWLDPDGECWWCPPDGPAYWSMANPAMVYGGWLLPAHAIPVPPENRPNG